MPENTNPETPNPPDPGPEATTSQPRATTETGTSAAPSEPADPATADAGDTAHETADEGSPTQVVTSYEHVPQGHRVTRRTVRRREIEEDTEETITDSYPVPYQPPAAPGQPAPVG